MNQINHGRSQEGDAAGEDLNQPLSERASEVPEQESPAERYGVEEFDLDRKRDIIETSRPYMPDARGIGGFCALVNELHYDAQRGILVSEADVQQIFRGCTSEAQQAFLQFVTDHSELVGGQGPEEYRELLR